MLLSFLKSEDRKTAQLVISQTRIGESLGFRAYSRIHPQSILRGCRRVYNSISLSLEKNGSDFQNSFLKKWSRKEKIRTRKATTVPISAITHS